MSVVYFLVVDFGEVVVFFVTGGKQSQLQVLGLRLEFDNNNKWDKRSILSPGQMVQGQISLG